MMFRSQSKRVVRKRKSSQLPSKERDGSSQSRPRKKRIVKRRKDQMNFSLVMPSGKYGGNDLSMSR
jgi:hypothetical protein